ncbi:hypothetical protein [Rhodococcus sovatensis]|uniref:Uncharacterized protein n=1 Tax=Rhodococcus sovatensis TaxID=1805840 RepID=A0ABZ2PN80_9NOCA
MWELEIDPACTVTIGWYSADGFGGFGRGEGMSMDAAYTDADAWVADTVQTHFAGYEFVQWLSLGRYLLTPQADEGGARCVDPHGETVVADIGSLCHR